MAAFVLDDYRALFRSEADFDRFLPLIEGATSESEMTPVWGKKSHLATLLSRTQAKALVQERMLQRILDDPSLLDEMKDRLENDELDQPTDELDEVAFVAELQRRGVEIDRGEAELVPWSHLKAETE